jgi:UDP-glucose 4-epimerase
MDKKLILVTGGAGFIGTHLCRRLVLEGYQVISLDNYFTGTKENHIAGAEYIEGHAKDIAKHITVKPNLIFHLGEYARVEKSFEDIKQVWDLNVPGTFSVLEFARECGAKVVYAGSSTKFGDGGMGRDQSPYAWTKATNTELVRNYGDWFNLDYAITYFYNVYGGRERSGSFGTLIAIFKERMEKGLPLLVNAPGSQRRNFTHVDDIVDGLVRVGKSGHGDEFGLGAPDSYSILEVAEMFGGVIEMQPEKKGNRMNGKLDIRRATGELGWEAKRTLPEYIQSICNK